MEIFPPEPPTALQSAESPVKICSTCFFVSDFTGFALLTITAIPSQATVVSLNVTPLALAAATSSGFVGRLAIPICAVPSMIAEIPVVDPSAAMLKVVSECCALNSSASCGTSFAPSVSDPLMTSVSPRAMSVETFRAINARKSFFIRNTCCLLDRNEPNLGDDFLAGGSNRVIEELFRETTWLAIRVIESRSPVSVGVTLNGLNRRSHAVDWQRSNTAGFGVSHADITNPVWIFADFSGDLFVAGHFLRAAGVIALLHRELLEIGIRAGRSVTCVDRDFSARTSNCAPILHVAGENLLHLFFRECFDRIRGIHDHRDPVISDNCRFHISAF